MKKLFFNNSLFQFILLLLILLLVPFSFIFADGGLILPQDYKDKDVYEPAQTSLIVYEGGKEDMYLRVNYEGEINNFVWIIPTPSYPVVDKAAEDIFKELSAVTSEVVEYNGDAQKSDDFSTLGAGTNVMVHEQKTLGIYEISILSATGADGLLNWLKENNYYVDDDIESILDWYVQKEWYFTAVRINPNSKLNDLVDDLSQIDSSVNKENFSDKLGELLVMALKNQDFEKFHALWAIYTGLDEDMEGETITEEEFLEKYNDEGMDEFTEEEWNEYEDEVVFDIKNLVENIIDLQYINDYSDYLEPIKASFNSSSIVYPLKISQISTKDKDYYESIKTNEVLLYVLTEKKVQAPGFKLEYGIDIDKEFLANQEGRLYEDLDSLKELIGDNKYYLTKMRRDFAKIEMDEDVYIINGDEYDPVYGDDVVKLSETYIKDVKYVNVGNNTKGSAMADRLKGKILIKVEDDGRAYYVDKETRYVYYLGLPKDAFNVMRQQGVGITNNNLEKIQVGTSVQSGPDSDSDGLSDLLEKTIGTNEKNIDTDGDVYSDKTEIDNEYDPNKKGVKLDLDKEFSQNQIGKIFLQVENNGEAWYINPDDAKRYFLGRPADAFEVMRKLGIGISNDDFDKL